MRILKKLICIAVSMAMLVPGTSVVYAEPGTVVRASDIEQYIDMAAPVTGTQVQLDERDDSIDTSAIFGTGRLKVRKELSTLEGAVKGVSYKGETLLCYGSAEAARDAYERLSAKYGEQNVIVDMPLFTQEAMGWGTDFMNLDDETRREVKTYNGSVPKVTVAVIDSGINRSHEVFRGKSISPLSKNIIDPESDVSDDNGHGTGVAGIIAESTPGSVEIMSLKVFGSKQNGTTEDINMAIEYAADNGADVINMSISSLHHEMIDAMEADYPNLIANYLRELDMKLKYAAMKGAVICAASGNDGGDLDELYSFPAFSQYTFAVGAIDRNGERARYSNYGQSLDFCAPGDDVELAVHSGETGFAAQDGTSFATPYISACCAYVKMNNKQANYKDAREILKSISVDYGTEGWDKYYGWGMPRYEEFVDSDDGTAEDPPEVRDGGEKNIILQKEVVSKEKTVSTIKVNKSSVSAGTIRKAIKKQGGSAKYVTKVVLGSKVKKIRPKAFAEFPAVKTIELKTRKLSKKSVKRSLKNSKVKTIRVRIGRKKVNKKYIKKYKKYFTAKNAGRAVRFK